MFEKISKLDSGVLRGLAVALIGLTVSIMRALGLGSEDFSAKALEIVDAALLVLASAGALYAVHARVNKPNPPLSDAAVLETQRLLDEGKLVRTSEPEGEEKL